MLACVKGRVDEGVCVLGERPKLACSRAIDLCSALCLKQNIKSSWLKSNVLYSKHIYMRK